MSFKWIRKLSENNMEKCIYNRCSWGNGNINYHTFVLTICRKSHEIYKDEVTGRNLYALLF